MKTRQAYINKFRSYLGANAKTIIDIYNSITPIPAGYKLTVGADSWCAATVSAVAHELGYDDIIPLECSCGRMIEKAQKMGIWVENDAYTPAPGDIILYDWQDTGKGDCTGWPDHVGAVVDVNSAGLMTIIEGNYNNTVKMRYIAVNERYIRGYICPKYDEIEAPAPSEPAAPENEEDGEMSQEIIFETINDVPTDLRPEIQDMINKGVFMSRTESGAIRIGLSESNTRCLVLMVRYIKKLVVEANTEVHTTATLK